MPSRRRAKASTGVQTSALPVENAADEILHTFDVLLYQHPPAHQGCTSILPSFQRRQLGHAFGPTSAGSRSTPPTLANQHGAAVDTAGNLVNAQTTHAFAVTRGSLRDRVGTIPRMSVRVSSRLARATRRDTRAV